MPQKSITIPRHWLPPAVAAALGRRTSIKFRAGERRVMRKRKPIQPSKWMEKHYVVTKSSVPGKWRNATAPYLAGIMDASFFENVQHIFICAAPQTGKSEAVNGCIAYAADQRPGDVLYNYPDEQTSKENSQDRIQAAIKASPRLKSYLTGAADDMGVYRINLTHMNIYMAWARSPARLANKPLPYVVNDEVDKFPTTSGKKESSPTKLAEKRTRIFRHMRKIWQLSSPTVESGPIWQAFTTEAQAIFDYWVRCPSCGGHQLMEFNEDRFKWPEDCRDPETIVAQDLAWYECQHCAARWKDAERDDAVRAGGWRDRKKGLALETYLKSFRPLKIGFHIPSWLSHFVGISEVCADFIKGLSDITAFKDFKNGHEAKPWRVVQNEREQDAVLALADDRPRGRVPGGELVAGLVAGVDTQKHGFWYEIRAFGFGLEKESWQIREGFVTTFDALKTVLIDDQYRDLTGRRYLVEFVVMDAMGEKTSEVYAFCRNHRNHIVPYKGEQRMAQPFAWTNLEYWPGTKKPIKGGLKLLRANTTYYKNELSNLLAVGPGDPGAWHMHAEVTEDWAKQMSAEYVDEKGLWTCPAGRANHAWDVSVYALVAADVIGLQYRKQPEPEPEPEPAPKPAPTPAGGWMGSLNQSQAGSWMNMS